jgi:hypothetical protein
MNFAAVSSRWTIDLRNEEDIVLMKNDRAQQKRKRWI